MGCAQSKIDNEEAVARCKERKQLMKDAVSARNAFAAAHSAYAMALKNTGAALSDYAFGEFLVSGAQSTAEIASSSVPTAVSPPPPPPSSSAATSNSSAAIPQPIPDTLPPPPPPPLHPLQRAATMPEMNGRSDAHSGNGLNGTIIEEDGTLDDEEDSESENHHHLVRKSRSRGGSNRGKKMIEEHQEAPPPPPANSRPIPPPRQQQHQHQQQQHPPFYDYIFPNVENMPGTTLEDTPPPPQSQPQATKPVSQPHSPVTEEEEDEEDEEDEEEEEEEETVVERKPPVAEMPKKVVEEVSVEMRGMKKSKGMAISGERRGARLPVANLPIVFNEIDDSFLKASESAHEVSKMLEATRLHYHSNFADNRGD